MIEDDLAPPLDEGPSASPVEALRDLVAGIQHYMDIEPDEEDKAEAVKGLAIFQGLLGRNQKQADSEMGTTDTHRFMRRQAGEV